MGVVCVVRSFYPVVALLLTEGIGSADCFKLPKDPEYVFKLLQTSRGRRELSLILRKPVAEVPWKAFDEQIEAIGGGAAGVVTFLDSRYPSYFLDIPLSPAILFYRGDLDRVGRRGVAIVGSRSATARGFAFARSLAGDLAALGILVASGAARGIDTAAHQGALERGGGTAAVLGTGLDVPYPRENAELLDRISRNGCVVTEQLMGTPPRRFVFPQRNRLISAVSQAVVVIEAGARSGALITAKWALEQGRDVGAVPGFPGDTRSRGTNALIRMGAFPVEGVGDILDAVPRLQLTAGPARPETGAGCSEVAAPLEGVSGEARAIFDVLSSAPIDPDTVVRHLGLTASVVQRSLLELEMRGVVERDRSGLYYKTRG